MACRAPEYNLQEILSCFVSQHKGDWDNWASLAVYTYNTSFHECTGLSPYELVVGKDPRTPLALELDLPLENQMPCPEWTIY